MDPLAGLLDGVRARGAFILRMRMEPPWSMRIRDDAPLTVICQTAGTAVVVGDTSGTTWLAPGDVALTRGTEHYIFADDPATTPSVVILPGQQCTTLSGESLHFEMSLGVRTWGNSSSGASQSIVGAYEGRSAVSARLLDALPPVVVVRGSDWDCPLVDLLAAEAGRDGPGQEGARDGTAVPPEAVHAQRRRALRRMHRVTDGRQERRIYQRGAESKQQHRHQPG